MKLLWVEKNVGSRKKTVLWLELPLSRDGVKTIYSVTIKWNFKAKGNCFVQQTNLIKLVIKKALDKRRLYIIIYQNKRNESKLENLKRKLYFRKI